jgi:hypothetical protein
LTADFPKRLKLYPNAAHREVILLSEGNQDSALASPAVTIWTMRLAAALLGACSMNAAAFAANMPVKAKKPPPAAASPFWIEADYLLWTVKGDKLPALVSSGVLGAPGTAGCSATRWQAHAEDHGHKSRR